VLIASDLYELTNHILFFSKYGNSYLVSFASCEFKCSILQNFENSTTVCIFDVVLTGNTLNGSSLLATLSFLLFARWTFFLFGFSLYLACSNSVARLLYCLSKWKSLACTRFSSRSIPICFYLSLSLSLSLSLFLWYFPFISLALSLIHYI
jgi:hypothetical protein